MRSLIFGFVPGRGLGLAAAAVLVSFVAFSGVTPARAQANTDMVTSLLGIFGLQSGKDQDAIDYRPRAPIVVPPRKDLPPPKAAPLHDPSWPNDADAAEQRRALLDSRRPAPQTTANGDASQTDQANVPVPVEGTPDECEAGGGTLCLATPWKFVKRMVAGFRPENVQLGKEPDRKYLIEPPPGYRKATAAAKAANDAPKDQPNTAGQDSSISSQSPKPAGN